MSGSDNVQHPSHYTNHPSGVECIEIVRHFNFNRGGAIKYIWRAGDKDPNKEIEDLEKAIFLLQDEVARIRGVSAVLDDLLDKIE